MLGTFGGKKMTDGSGGSVAGFFGLGGVFDDNLSRVGIGFALIKNGAKEFENAGNKIEGRGGVGEIGSKFGAGLTIVIFGDGSFLRKNGGEN